MADCTASTPEEYRQWWEENTDALYGTCWCGCGKETKLADRTHPKFGVKGEPRRWINRHYNHGRPKGPPDPHVEEYREKWQRDYPSIPYGQCCCGCGEKTTVSDYTSKSHGYVRDQPRWFITGHHDNGWTRGDEYYAEDRRLHREAWQRDHPDIAYGYCICGCGEKTSLAPQPDPRFGLVRGAPYKRIQNHSKRHTAEHKRLRAEKYRKEWERQRPDIPYGYCWCGCGEKTSLAEFGHLRNGYVTGQPVRYVFRHYQPSIKPWQHTGKITTAEVKARREQLMANRRSYEQSAEGSHTFEEILRMIRDQADLCAYCECPLGEDWHVEHMIPLSRGGSNDWANIAISCADCNRRKGSKTVEEFMPLIL